MAPLPAVDAVASPLATPLDPGSAPLDLVVAGCGVVGRAFLRAAAPAVRAGVLRVVAVSDSTGTLHDPAGLDPAAAAAAKEAGGLGAGGLRLLPWRGADAARFLSCDAVVDLAPGGAGASSLHGSPLAAALEAGRDAVTAAKSALALFPEEIESLRRAAGARLLASAAVAGGVPLLELLGGALRGAGIEEVAGAWNATSTFVLDRVEEGASAEEALADARRLGFAEADASEDLDGRDAAAKACIVSAAAFGRRIRLDAVARRGLEGLDADAVRAAARRGRRTRLVARVTPAGARVGLEALPEDHPLAAVAGEARVSIRSSLAGIVSLRGPGAGGPATASAVLSDCLALAASRGCFRTYREPRRAQMRAALGEAPKTYSIPSRRGASTTGCDADGPGPSGCRPYGSSALSGRAGGVPEELPPALRLACPLGHVFGGPPSI